MRSDEQLIVSIRLSVKWIVVDFLAPLRFLS